MVLNTQRYLTSSEEVKPATDIYWLYLNRNKKDVDHILTNFILIYLIDSPIINITLT